MRNHSSISMGIALVLSVVGCGDDAGSGGAGGATTTTTTASSTTSGATTSGSTSGSTSATTTSATTTSATTASTGTAMCLMFGSECEMTDICCDAAGETGQCYAFGRGPKCTIPCPANPDDCPNGGLGCNNMDPAVFRPPN